MWGVDVKLLCRQHLLGEHVEMHMLAGTLMKGKSIEGYVKGGLVNPKMITARHHKLAVEMVRRGYNHKSPLLFDSSKLKSIPLNVKNNIEILRGRCVSCVKNGL